MLPSFSWLLLLLLPLACGPRVLFRGEEPGLGTVYVVREGQRRVLRFGHPDAEDQSVYDPSRPDHEPLGYVRSALMALAHAQGGQRLLMIGLGGGSYLRHVRLLAPKMALEAVEVSPLVVQLCRRYFALPRGVEIHVEDGRRFVRRTRRHYDVVFVDAYDAVDYPSHLGTREFFGEVRRILAPGGVVAANLSPNTDEMEARLVYTFRAVFPRAGCFSTAAGNSVLIGWTGVQPGQSEVRARLRRLEVQSRGRYGLMRAADQRCKLMLDGARLLVDPR